MIILHILFLVFSLLYLIQVCLYYYHWRRTPTSIKLADPIAEQGISIIIVVRNESASIRACLENVFAQSYLNYEVILVDDFSTDQTISIAEQFRRDHFSIISLSSKLPADAAYKPNKKEAIELAVRLASYELIACTDGDCLVPKHWLAHINSAFADKTIQYITAPVQLKPGSTLLEKFQEIDVQSLMGITAASIGMQEAYMSNGANMAFRKEAFVAIGAYTSSKKMATGDDVFLMHSIIKKYGSASVQFIKSVDMIVFTTACSSFAGFLQQRIRWVSKSTYLENKKATYVLMFMYCYHLLFLIYGVLSFGTDVKVRSLLLIYFLLKILIDFLFLNSVSSFFKRRNLLWGLAFFEVLYIFYVVIIGLLGLRGKYHWKARSI